MKAAKTAEREATKAAKKAAAAQRTADSVCGCDGTCGRDVCRGRSNDENEDGCKGKVTNSRARQCNQCRYAVEARQKACATCKEATSKGACSCVDDVLEDTKADSTPEPALLEGLLVLAEDGPCMIILWLILYCPMLPGGSSRPARTVLWTVLLPGSCGAAASG